MSKEFLNTVKPFIILTKDEAEVNLLKFNLGERIDYDARPKMNYFNKWYWYVDSNDKLAGVSQSPGEPECIMKLTKKPLVLFSNIFKL